MDDGEHRAAAHALGSEFARHMTFCHVLPRTEVFRASAGFVTTPRGSRTTPRRLSLSGQPLRVPSLDIARMSPTAQIQVRC